MKIYSWNMLYRNPKQDAAFAYLSGLDFDLLCLQEVPEEFLPRLRELPYQMVSTVDATLTRGSARVSMYHAILSRNPIHHAQSFDMPKLSLPFRSVIGLRLKEGWTDIARREGLYADVALSPGMLRVFSFHPAVLSPLARTRDFETLALHLPDGFPAVVAGDFNIADHPAVKPFSWFFGASLAECAPWHDERSDAEQRFTAWGFANPLRGKVTLPITLSQLDHILVPKDATVHSAEVVRHSYGSDHYPVFIEASW